MAQSSFASGKTIEGPYRRIKVSKRCRHDAFTGRAHDELPTPSDWGSAGGGEPSAKFLAEPSPHMPNFDQILLRAPPRQVRKGADAGIHVQSEHATAASASASILA
jgi:hypothetical protein